MKKYSFFLISLLICFAAFSQPGKKPVGQKQPSSAQPDMNKMLEEAMKQEGLSKEEQEEMRKMMKDLLPAMQEQNEKAANYPLVTDNKQLVPQRDAIKIASLSNKALTKSDIVTYTATLYTKLLAKGNADEITLAKKIIDQSPTPYDISRAVILCMLQGHQQAAMLLSMKAVMAEPANPVWQNNMAALLTQYGYPEKAIPLLRKLYLEFPDNSTVLNNLAYAWLGLGETDSVRSFAGAAIRSNPLNPDARLCGGLMDELYGDPKKAGDEYTGAYEDHINPFTKEIMKNHDPVNKETDFEKIKRSIPTREYFPPNYLPDIPLLNGGVSNYAYNQAIKEGYRKMMDSLSKRIEDMTMVLGKNLDNLAEKGEDEFVKEMTKQNMEGLSFISSTASQVMKILLVSNEKWHVKTQKQEVNLANKIAAWTKEMDAEIEKLNKVNCKDEACNERKCRQVNEVRDRYTAKVNPLVKDFWLTKAEEQRQLLNATITWNWYVTGNIKNVVLMQDIQMAAYLVQLYQSAVMGQQVFNGYCKPQKETDSKYIPVPDLPNFTCPAVVSIPSGADWSELTASTKNFDNNVLGVKKTNAPVPNTSVSFSIGKRIGQAGEDASLKTANGSVTASYVNPEQRKLTPDEQHKANMEMLDAMPDFEDWRHQQSLEKIKQLPSWGEILAIKALINKMMSADCNKPKPKAPEKKKTFVVGKGKLRFEESREVVEDMVIVTYDDGSVEFFDKDGNLVPTKKFTVGKGELTFDEIDKDGKPVPVKKFTVGKGELTFEEIKVPANPTTTQPPFSAQKLFNQMSEAKRQYDANGLTPAISSSLQSPNTFKAEKNLFQ
jgi:Flp pilus assembly protein TadD